LDRHGGAPVAGLLPGLVEERKETQMRGYWMQMTDTRTMLELRQSPMPEPGAQQLLVRMRAASLNRGEFVLGHGLHGQPGSWKAIGGEGAGEVVAVGADASAFRPGDRVMGRCAGAFSEYALMDVAEAMVAPPALSWEEAASIPLTFLVAFDMLMLQGRLQAGEWLLINGVSSGVGVASLQLGKLLGAKVIGTSGSAGKLETLRPLGLDVALCTRAADFAPAVMEATGRHGADLVVNAVGGSVFAENIRAMAFEGRLATVGYVDNVLHADLDLEALHARRLTLFGVSNKQRTKAQRAAAVPRFVAEVMPHFASGRIRPQIDQVTAFEQLPAAKERMEAGGHVGKIVLRMPDAS
jgi:NADPH:quinone reductase